MHKKTLYLFFLGACLLLASCNKSKEDQLKTMLGLPQNQAGEKLDPVANAEKNPSFDNEIAAGLSLSQAGKSDKALVYFQRALKKNPTSSLANNNVCAEYNALHNWNAAISHCEKALQATPDFQLAKNNLKFARDQQQAQMKVIEALKAKSESSKGKERRAALVELGFEYYKMGDYAEAVNIWKKVDKTKDDLSVRTLNNLGSAYILLKHFDLAQSALEEASKMDPNNQLVKNNMVWLKSASAEAAAPASATK
jgi:tetratricopeptide (TPR) repeat protein